MTPSAAFIAEQIEQAAHMFAPDELAFLALTSKIERSFLDRLAYQSFLALRESEYTVTRELKLPNVGRADLAFIRGNGLITIIEGKAMMSFDCTRVGPMQRQYADALQFDLDRYVNAGLPDVEIYCLLLSSHPLSRIPEKYARALKYSAAYKRAYRRFGSASGIRETAEKNLLGFLRRDIVRASGAFNGGIAFGVGVEVLWWLFGPFRCPADLSILRSAT